MPPIPFIIYTPDNGFSLAPEAVEFLNSIADTPLAIISTVGAYRTGKSFFLNRVLLNSPASTGFAVGPTIHPCTKGLWLSTTLLPHSNLSYPSSSYQVLLVDSEGFGGMDQSLTHNSRIGLFSLLISSMFIYNSVGIIDENTINNLSLIVNLGSHYIGNQGYNSNYSNENKLNKNDKNLSYPNSNPNPSSNPSPNPNSNLNSNPNPNSDSESFPSLLWILRDFALKMTDSDGRQLKGREYLEKALDEVTVRNNPEKVRVRRVLKGIFRERDCQTLVRPIANEAELQRLNTLRNEEFRKEFLSQAEMVRKSIFGSIKPKMMRGRGVNGGMLLALCRKWIEVINDGGMPEIESTWKYICQGEIASVFKECEEMVEKCLAQKFESDLDFELVKKEVKKEIFAYFNSKTKMVNSREERKFYKDKIKIAISDKFEILSTSKIRKNEEVFNKICDEKYYELTEKFGNARENEFFQPDFIFKYQSELKSSIDNIDANLKINRTKLENSLFSKTIIFLFDKLSYFKTLSSKITQNQISNLEAELKALKLEKEREKNNFVEKISALEFEKTKMSKNKIESDEREKKMGEKLKTMYNEMQNKENKLRELPSNQIRNEELVQMIEELKKEKNHLETQIKMENNKKMVFIKNLTAETERKNFKILEEKNDLSVKYNQILTEKKNLEDEFFNISAQLSQFKENMSTTTFHNITPPSPFPCPDSPTNRALSSALESLSSQLHYLKQKQDKLRIYKNLFNSSLSFQCFRCHQFFPKEIFSSHLETAHPSNMKNNNYQNLNYSNNIVHNNQNSYMGAPCSPPPAKSIYSYMEEKRGEGYELKLEGCTKHESVLNNDSKFMINESKISTKPGRYAYDPNINNEQNKTNQSLNLSCIAGKKVNSSMGLEKLTVDEIFAPMEENFLSVKNVMDKKEDAGLRYETRDRNNYNVKYDIYEKHFYDKTFNNCQKEELNYNEYEGVLKSKEEKKKENLEEIIRAINKNDRYAILQAKKKEIMLTSQEHWTNKKVNKTCGSNKKNWDMEEAVTRREEEVRKRWRREEEGLKTKDKRKYSNNCTRIVTTFN